MGIDTISFTLSEVVAGLLTLIGLFSTAYNLYARYQDSKKTGLKENTQNAVKWVEIDNSLKTMNIQQANIITTIGEYKTKLDTIMDAITHSKDEVKELKHQFELLKKEFENKVDNLRKEQDDIMARLVKANM